MSDQSNSSGGNTGIAFIVGALVVVVAILAYFMLAGGDAVSVEGPDTVLEDAAEAVSDN
ncbi:MULTISPECIES: hypothetical protein [unclassified Roseobacter]|uniref:hypothetical protein n=1 Tax=unclassified Roseobacter TaxID=196798 RepID=UPI0018A27D3E|nr:MULTISPECIES: hypothetical protein [unclassified Roseobacter]MDW3183837.1 hypothetical protein [Roseobacter sp.]